MRIVTAWWPVFLWVSFILHMARTPHLRVLSLLRRLVILLAWPPAHEVVEFLDSQAGEYVLRKSAHMLVYFALGLLLYRALALTLQRAPAVTAGSALLLGLAVAMYDEFGLQAQTVGRHASLSDVGLDLIGIGSAVVLFCWFSVRNPS